MSNQPLDLDSDEKSFFFNLLGMSSEIPILDPPEKIQNPSPISNGFNDLEELFDGLLNPSIYQFTMTTPPESDDAKSESSLVKTTSANKKLRITGTITARQKWNDDRLEWLDLVDRNSDGKFACPKCPRLYTRKSNLKVHYASSHIGLKRFGCPECSKQFARRTYVRQHQRICPKNNCF